MATNCSLSWETLSASFRNTSGELPYDRIEEAWTGDRWRTVGREIVTEVRVRAVVAAER